VIYNFCRQCQYLIIFVTRISANLGKLRVLEYSFKLPQSISEQTVLYSQPLEQYTDAKKLKLKLKLKKRQECKMWQKFEKKVFVNIGQKTSMFTLWSHNYNTLSVILTLTKK